MKILYIAVSCVAFGVAQAADAQGPVTQTLQGAGEIAADGTRAVVQGTGEVARGAGRAAVGVAQGAADATRTVVGGAADATRAVVGGAADATRSVVGGAVDATGAVVGGTARGIRAGVDAITPGLPLQARAGARLRAGEDARDARWRFAQHRGEWWYYSPSNAWMYHRDGQWNQFSQDSFTPNPALAGQQFADQQYAGAYGTGYRGVDGGQPTDAGVSHAQGPVYRLQHDAQGREFICENGRRVYFDDGQAGDQQGAMGAPQTPDQPTPPPAISGSATGAGLGAGATGSANANGVSGQPGANANANVPTPATPTPSAAGAATSGAIQGSPQ